MLKCDHCLSYFLIKNSKKNLTARISLKKDDHITWYSVFSPILEAIVQKYNEKYDAHEVLDEIDEEKISEIILLSEGIKLNVNKNNIVTSIAFV